LNMCVLCTLHVLHLEHIKCPIFVVQLRLQDFAVLDYLPVDGSEDATRVSFKESISGTGSSLGGREGKNRFHMKSKSRNQSRFEAQPRHNSINILSFLDISLRILCHNIRNFTLFSIAGRNYCSSRHATAANFVCSDIHTHTQ